MTRREQKRIVRELTENYRQRLMKAVGRFPPTWDGRHIRALLAHLVKGELEFDCVKKADREMKRSMTWFTLPL